MCFHLSLRAGWQKHRCRSEAAQKWHKWAEKNWVDDWNTCCCCCCIRSIKNAAAAAPCTWLLDYKRWQELQDEIFRIMYCWEDLGGVDSMAHINVSRHVFFFFFLLYGGHKEMSGGWFIWDSGRLMRSRHHNNVRCLLLFLHSSDRVWDQCLAAAGCFVTAGGGEVGGLEVGGHRFRSLFLKNDFRRLVAFCYKINVSLYVEKNFFKKRLICRFGYVCCVTKYRHLQITVQPTCCCWKFKSFCFAFIESDDSRVKRRLFLLRMPVFMCNTNQLHKRTDNSQCVTVASWRAFAILLTEIPAAKGCLFTSVVEIFTF